MPTFVVLIDFTERGIRSIRESPRRADAFRSQAAGHGVDVKEIYWTLGHHDGVLVLEAPDGKKVSSLLLSLAQGGNVRTHALRAFDEAEMEEVIAGMS